MQLLDSPGSRVSEAELLRRRARLDADQDVARSAIDVALAAGVPALAMVWPPEIVANTGEAAHEKRTKTRCA